MINSNKQYRYISLTIFLAVFIVVCFLGLNAKSAFAQDQDYYQEYEDQTEVPEHDEPTGFEEIPDNGNQNPDPEFMEEQEPGVYDQSDDTTELSEDSY